MRGEQSALVGYFNVMLANVKCRVNSPAMSAEMNIQDPRIAVVKPGIIRTDHVFEVRSLKEHTAVDKYL